MGLWKQLIPDLKVDKLIDMSREELTKIDAVVNSGVIDSGGRVLDNVMSPADGSTVNVIMINSTVSLSAPSPIRPTYYRRRRDVEMSEMDHTGGRIMTHFNNYINDLKLSGAKSPFQAVMLTLFGVVLLCLIIR